MSSPRALRILIVEDDPEELSILTRNLTLLGFEVVVSCTSLTDFQAKYRSVPFDLAIVDLRLGEASNRDGLKIARFLQQHERLLIIHTGYATNRVYNLVHRNDRTDIMTKPSRTPGDWRTRITTVLSRVFTNQGALQRFRMPPGTRTDVELMEEVIQPYFFRDIRVPYNELVYLETRDGGLIFHFLRRSLRVSDAKLEDFWEACTHGNMMRIHRSFVINRNRIIRASPNRIILELGDSTEKVFTVGKTFRDEVLAYLSAR